MADKRSKQGGSKLNNTNGTGAATATADAPAANAAQIRQTRSYNPAMEYRRLGKTGLWVSAVCLGGHWKRIDKVVGQCEGPAADAAAKAAFDANRHDVVSRCIDAGINYIDACMGCEVIAYAKALKGRRDSVYLGYSWYEKEPRMEAWRTEARLLQGLEESLKEAGLDYVDIWRVTMLEQGSQHTDAECEALVAAFAKAKQQGKCRFVGFSSHDRPWIGRMVARFPEIQVVLTPYLPEAAEQPRDGFPEVLRKADVGVFGIKPFVSHAMFKGDGSPDSPYLAEDDRRARLAIRSILANPAVTASIPGLTTVHQVENVLAAMKEGSRLSGPERTELGGIIEEMWGNLPADYNWLRSMRHI
jgi:aryl-alcohol dehydrogenase-like predicted oxidoreductase